MLYVVATPIGNLDDISLRAILTLKTVNFILAEDTRVTQKLLDHLGIETPRISFHEHSKENKYEKILNLLEEGRDLALVSDAGTPGLSDPGAFLIKTIREKLPEVEIRAIPGPSALTTLISISGVDVKKFTFFGFPPHKKKRKTFFEDMATTAENNPVIFYESKHRVVKAMESLQKLMPKKKIIIGREMTKIFEEVLIGTPGEILESFTQYPKKLKGEFVILIS